MSQQNSAGHAAILDELIPLRGASHEDVIAYGVHVPMRYAECYALLPDGQRIRLSRNGAFRGWRGGSSLQSLLFKEGNRQLELMLTPSADADDRHGQIRDIKCVSDESDCLFSRQSYTGVDGIAVPVSTS